MKSNGATLLRLQRTLPSRVLPVLDDSQTVVAAHTAGPLLVLGGPGTGKTTSLIEAAACRVSEGVDPARVLFLTLGRAAVATARLELAARLPDHPVPDVRTWHGFAYGVVDADRVAQAREATSGEQAAVLGPLQLLSGAEVEARIRELLSSDATDGSRRWPTSLAAALPTRGFARDLRGLLVALSTLALEPSDLAALARGVDDQNLAHTWQAAAEFAAEAFDVFGFEGVTDHADVLNRAGNICAADAVPRYDYVYVDIAQDLDPAMVRLLAALARGTTAVVLAADPDQAVEGFRGADPRLLSDLGLVLGEAVPVHLLTTDHAHDAELHSVVARVTSRIPAPLFDVSTVQALRSPQPSGATPSAVQIRTFDSPSAEAAHIADLLLRRANDAALGWSWSDMAVVVHSTSAFGALARAFTSAGIPFDTPRDEVPLRDDPAARVLISVLELAVTMSRGATPAPEALRAFVLGPLVHIDSAALRRVSRQLRAAARAAGDFTVTSDAALAAALVDPRALLDVPDDADVTALLKAAQLLRATADAVRSQRSISEVLWTLWQSAEQYGARLGELALRGGAEGRRANRDLDAIMGLFDAAERADARYQGRRGVAAFLDEINSLDFAAETLAERGAPAPAVTILTARRARGQFWPLVVVCGLNDGEWPRLSGGANIVGADRLSAAGVVPPPSRSARLADERRVFHVAVSRATRELVLTGVASADENGAQPSGFLRDIARLLEINLDADLGPAPAHTRGYPRRPLNALGAVAALRRTAVEGDDPRVTNAVAHRLARLALLTDPAGETLMRGAHPGTWWGFRKRTVNDRPLHDPQRPVELSATGMKDLEDCALRRFFTRDALARTQDAAPAAFGTVIHAIAEALFNEQLPPELQAVDDVIDSVWPNLASDAEWAAAQERTEATALADRLLRWMLADRGREAKAGELTFHVPLTVPLPDGGTDDVVLKGSIDRVEVDVDDPTGVHIIDFKTSKYAPVIKDLPEHPQLGIYRVIVEEGGLDDTVQGAHVAGAELVELRITDANDNARVYSVSGPTDGTWPERIGAAAWLLRNEVLVATPTDSVCRTCPIERLCPAKSAGQQVIP